MQINGRRLVQVTNLFILIFLEIGKLQAPKVANPAKSCSCLAAKNLHQESLLAFLATDRKGGLSASLVGKMGELPRED